MVGSSFQMMGATTENASTIPAFDHHTSSIPDCHLPGGGGNFLETNKCSGTFIRHSRVDTSIA